MKLSASCRIVAAGLCAVAGLAVSPQAPAAIVGPYFDLTDTNTLHLWHLDGSAAPVADRVVGGGMSLAGLLNGATLDYAGYSGFGTALNTASTGNGKNAVLAAGAAGGNVTITVADPDTGAFTFEALVRIGFDPSTNGTSAYQILSGESGASANRIFQWRIMPRNAISSGSPPALTFENVRMVSGNQPTIYAPIPTDGPDAIAYGQWYHVAVTYNGVPNTAGNFKFYWTLMDPSRTAVSPPLAITSPTTMLTGLNPLATITTPFMVGNQARNLNGNFLGQIDEVRISRIARDPSDMMFNTFAPTNPPVVVTSPVDAMAAPGDPVTLNVLASGAPTLAYQWRMEGTNLPGATASAYAIAAMAAANAGTYEVVVTNNYGAATSAMATVVLRTPRSLTWVGSAGATWDTTAVNWDSNGDTLADTAYTERDNVIFNSTGSAAPVVTLSAPHSPYSMTVNADTDYTLTGSGTATLSGMAQFLKKSGSGTLILDVDWPGLGASTIQSGTVQLGNASASGTLGYGPVTNNGTLLLNRSSGALSFTNWLVGTGSLTNNGAATLSVSGTNLLSGPITLNGGTLALANPQAKGLTTQYTLNASANWPGIAVGGGVTFGPDITISMLGTTVTPDYRCGINSTGGTNTLNCGLVLDGSGSIAFGSLDTASTSLFVVTTPLINCPDYTGQLQIRGAGNGLLTSQINFGPGSKVSKTDGGTWKITSTGNSWSASDVGAGTLVMGANNVLPSSVTLNILGATAVLDLAGFNQTVDTLTGPGIIANSSTSADSTLTVHPSSLSFFSGVIKDSVSGGTHKVGLTVSSGTLSLSGANTYTGPTTIASGSLQLVLNGGISNSASITLGPGAALDATTRSDFTFTLNPGQTLQGDGQFGVYGNLVSAGTIKMKLSKSGSTLANDSLYATGGFTCGGTLLVDLSASPGLAPGDAFPLFSAGGGFSGAFLEVLPGPGFGLAWDTSTLAIDGTLRVVASSVPSTGTSIVSTVTTDQQLSLSWPANYIGWRLQAQTNSPHGGLSTNWVYVPGSSVTNQMFFPLNKAAGSVFYRMVYP